jgi:hypothetical protein
MIDINNIKIAVDFDGTIVDHQYPDIGKENLFAFQTLKELEKRGARLILWTFRTGKAGRSMSIYLLMIKILADFRVGARSGK